MSPRIRVLVADDSATVRSALCALLGEDPHLEVVGQAADGVEAVSMAKTLRPDVITMDVLMPRLGGLEAIEAIMAEAPSRILVVSSVAEDRQLDLSFRAIAAGALELISKPSRDRSSELREWGRRVAESVRLMSEVPVITRHRRAAAPVVARPGAAGGVDAFGVVASTGGPAALAQIFGALPRELPVPLFVAQHIAEGFTNGLLRWLAQVSPLAMILASSGMACQPGHVYLPPDGHDLEVDPEGLLRVSPSQGGHCPSGDKLLGSMAAAYGARGGGVVLTGMGDDGARGLLALRGAGGVTLAQDEQSSVVFGMPQAAFAMGAAQRVVPLEAIAPLLLELCVRPDGLGARQGR